MNHLFLTSKKGFYRSDENAKHCKTNGSILNPGSSSAHDEDPGILRPKGRIIRDNRFNLLITFGFSFDRPSAHRLDDRFKNQPDRRVFRQMLQAIYLGVGPENGE